MGAVDANSALTCQFHRNAHVCRYEIARHFRVPPTFLYDFGRATWSNGEQMSGMFLTFTIVPWLLRWEGEIALKLFTLRNAKPYSRRVQHQFVGPRRFPTTDARLPASYCGAGIQSERSAELGKPTAICRRRQFREPECDAPAVPVVPV